MIFSQRQNATNPYRAYYTLVLCAIFSVVVSVNSENLQATYSSRLETNINHFSLKRPSADSFEKDLGVSVSQDSHDITKINPLADKPSVTYETYTVKKKDTLARIAKRFNVSINEIRALNSLTKKQRLHIGQVLRLASTPPLLPPSSQKELQDTPIPSLAQKELPSLAQKEMHTYQVRKGDSFRKIARRFGIKISDLRSYNGLEGKALVVGQTLKIVASHQPKPGPDLSDLDRLLGNYLAQESHRIGTLKNTHGYCLRSVRHALNNVRKQSGEDKISSMGVSAESFRKLVAENPVYVCEHYGLADVTSLGDLPFTKGVIHLWGKGQCGFSRRNGHIEVAVDSERGCSDHCRVVDSCQPDLKLAFVNNCDWLKK